MDSQKSGITFNTRDDLSMSSEDKKIKLDDDNSISSTEDIFFNKTFKATHFVFENIRFCPKAIEFLNAFEGKQFSERLTIQNIGKNPVLVKIGEPNSFVFQLKKPSLRARFLPSGASITKTITYTCHSDDLVQKSQIPIYVNGTLVDYPIIVKQAEPEIEIHPQKLNFEIINLGASAKSMTLTIHNAGGRRTNFEVDCGKHLDLVVSPMRGTVKPKHSVNVSVEIMGFQEGIYYRELWIKTTEAPIRVPVLVEVVRPRLEIVYPTGTENFTLINFRPTFKGTQRVSPFLLKNVSNETTLFVVLAEVDGRLVNLTEGKQLSDSFSMFLMTVEEGILAPFESRIFNVLFCPKQRPIKKGWHHTECRKKALKGKTECDQIAFVCIRTVYYMERRELVTNLRSANSVLINRTELQKSESVGNDVRGSSIHHSLGSGNLSRTVSNFVGQREEKSLRFCLHGQAVDPDILIQPSSLEFGELSLGQTDNRVLRLTNKSKIGVRCRICKTMNIITKPQTAWLNGEKSHEFLIRLTPKCGGIFKLEMRIQVLAQSELPNGKISLETIASYTVPIIYTAHDVFKTPAPKVGLGITPLVTDEVGFQKDYITYKDVSKLPYAAVLSLKKGFKPEWMKEEKVQVDNVDNALVALPNDRPRLFYSWPRDKVCRSIFKGFFRYSPPEDLAYTLSLEGRLEKKERLAIWAEYISKKLRRLNRPSPKMLTHVEELSCGHQDSDCRNLIGLKNSKRIKDTRDPSENLPKLPLIPLSPLFLFLIKVEPKMINFGIVAESSATQETIIINNENPFPINIRFIPGNANVSMTFNGTSKISPLETKSVKVFFKSKDFGRYFGFLNYVINGAHEFKITISAFVTSKTLFVSRKYFNLEFRKYGSKDPFQHTSVFFPLENVLPSPVRYRLSLLEDTAFGTEITEGEVPAKSIIFAEVFLALAPRKSFYSEISLVSESGHTELIKISCPCKKISVDFLSSEVDMGDIPLNLPTKARPIILNACYHDVSFEVLTSEPMPKVTIMPKTGIIRARSFFYLEITVKIPVAMKFSFSVVLSVHFSHKIALSVTGNVVHPLIRIRPSEVVLRKIWCQSLDTFTICATNEGTTRAEIKLELTSCPEHIAVEGGPEIYLPPNESRKISFRFSPINVSRYVFYLPFVINDILGPPMIQEKETEFSSYFISEYESEFSEYGQISNVKVMLPCVSINCIVIDSLLQVTPLNIAFREQNSEFQPQKVEITNVSDEVVGFCIKINHLGEENECPFEVTLVEPSPAHMKVGFIKASLSPDQKLVLKTTFTPRKYGLHTIEVPIYVKEYNKELPCNNIQLSGSLEAPRIVPMSSEVYFLPLPLGVASEVVITICTENYRNPDTIKCLLWDSPRESLSSLSEQITTKWLTEPHVTENRGTQFFQLQIVFQSFVPVALKSYLVLIDSTGVYSTILVSAVADNSALTVHTFLMKKTSKYKLKSDSFVVPKVKEEDVIKTETKSELKLQGHSKSTVEYYMNSLSPESSAIAVEVTEKGPVLVIQLTKSMCRLSHLGFATVLKTFPTCRTTPSNSAIFKTPTNDRNISLFSPSESLLTSKMQLNSSQGLSIYELPFPSFPFRENVHWEYFNNLLTRVERWMFEVVMRCDQYLSIPESFQRIMKPQLNVRNSADKFSKCKENDFLNFLEEIFGHGVMSHLPRRPHFSNKQTAAMKAQVTRAFFLEVLRFLQSKGCLLPHIKAEYLMEYDDYEVYTKCNENAETFSWDIMEVKKTNMKMAEEASDQSKMDSSKGKLEKEVISKEDSSVLFSKDFWAKSFSESVQLLDIESEKADEGNQEYSQVDQNLESTWNLVGKKQFRHRSQVLDKATFQARSTQAWLDIVIQIFRVFILSKINKRNTIPLVKVYEMSDKKIVEIVQISSVRNYFRKVRGSTTIPVLDSLSSNIYTSQERLLLAWLNNHLQTQRDILWQGADKCSIRDKILNNFHKDLSDSVALICLTAAHCPYIVSEYFKDVFAKPETPNKILHNAVRLIQAWRTLQLGISVDTCDITNPNPVFMIMLLTHLYDVLPSLHPRQCICFSAPLNSEISRTIQLRNESQCQLFYEGKFFGEDQMLFRLKESLIEIKPLKTASLTVIFSVKKIRKIAATLFLNGCSVSPDFAKNLVFYLEGEPSEILEYEKMSFTASLYKVICSNIPVKSPYRESATYEIWYTTKKPEYSGDKELSLKRWSSIWKAKVSRRLFLNKGEIKVEEGKSPPTVSVTVACLTLKKRNFWLVFRSDIGDFVILIEINARQLDEPLIVNGYYSELWSPSASCTCPEKTARKFDAACPFFVMLKIPARNNALWNALRKMFFKTLSPHEALFWNKHFEMDIGLCLILWLLNQEEEEEVLDEFVDVLATRVTFTLQADPPDKCHVTLPAQLEVPDVREDSAIDVPIHISKETPKSFKLVMTSENKKEIRILKVILQPSDPEHPGKGKTMIISF